jgi:lipooligosaccharide transport system permease protein
MAAAQARRHSPRLQPLAVRGVMLREFLNFSAFWRSSVFSATAEPAINMLAFGFGFGSLVTMVGGYDYMDFVGTGMVAVVVLFTGALGGMYATFAKYKLEHVYDAILSAPVDTEELVTGEVLWTTIHGAVFGSVTMLVAVPFGLDPSWGMLLVPFVAGVACFGWASFGVFVASRVQRIETLTYWQSLVLTPVFLVAGTFFPLSTLPSWAQALGSLNPLFHCVELVRHAVFGFEGRIDVGHAAVLAGFALVWWRIAICFMERRLIG